MPTVAVRLNGETADFEKAFTSSTRTVAGFEKAFGAAASSLQGHKKKIDAAFQSFAGDKIISEANQYAAAVAKVGGAAKLTEAEQRRVNATVTEAIAKYRALGQSAPAELLKLAGATKAVEAPTLGLARALQQVEVPASGASKAMGLLGTVFTGFTAANLAASAISAVVGKVKEFAEQGAKLPGLQSSFERLTDGIGQSSAGMLSAMQESTRGLVSNVDLMQSANKAILLGLPVTTDEMGKLAKTATVLGKAMGQDATSSLNDLITALGRSSPLILDNLGLTVKVGEANEAYAAKIGRTAEQLTDAEKKTAFYVAAMAAADRKTKELGDQTQTLGEIVSRVWVTIGNNITESVGDINVVLGHALSSGQNFLKFLKEAATFNSWEDMANAIEAANKRQLKAPVISPGALARESEVFKLEEFERQAKRAAEALVPLTERQRQLAQQLALGGKSASEIANKLNEFSLVAGVTERQIQPLVDRLQDSKRAMKEQAEAALEIERAQRPLTAAQKFYVDQLVKVVDGEFKLAASESTIAKKLNVSSEAVKSYTDAWKEYVKNLEMVRKVQDGISKLPGTQLPAPDWAVATNQFRIDPNQFPLANLPGVQMPIPKLTTEQEQILKDELRRVQRHFEETWGLIQVGAKRFGNDLAQALADGIRTGDWTAAKDAMQDAVSDFMSTGIEAGLNMALPGLGTLMKPLIDLVTDKIVGLFRDSAHEHTNDIRDAFLLQFGPSGTGIGSGFSEFARLMHEAGPAGDELFKRVLNAKKVEEFNAAMAAANDLLDRTAAARPENQAAAAGFETIAELQAKASAAVKVYEYIRDSGLYSAETVAKAWERANAALIASGDEQAIAAKKAADALSEVDAKLKSLYDSIANEAPEAEMGVIEANARAEIARIEEQKRAQEAASADQAATAVKAYQDANGIIIDDSRKMYDEIGDIFAKGYEVPIYFKFPNGTPSFGGVSIPALAQGGIVREPTLALIGEAGPEVVEPLSSYNKGARGGVAADGSVIFQRGAFEGMVVDSRERVDQLVESISTAIRRGGRARKAAKEAGLVS